jgi:pyruvate dehydrogenase E1 component alpha subunit
VCFFGDGAANQGLLLESMNMASIWSLPVIYACEHNQYGEYTPAEAVTAGELADRGRALNIPTTVVNGMDVLAVYEAAQTAVARGRAGEGPSFLVCQTYRYGGHGMSDRDRPYRTRDEEESWKLKDPLQRLREQLIAAGAATGVELDAIQSDVEREMNEAVEYGLSSPPPAPEEVKLHVYAD